MRGKFRLMVLFAALAVSIGLVAPAGATAATPFCGITWGSLAKAGGALNSAQLTNVRAEQHICFDRVVFDLQNAGNGYRVEYVNTVYSQGQGVLLSVPGGAKLNVTLLEPSDEYGAPVGTNAADVAGFRTLRSVVYGGTFEGYTTFGIGTRAKLPFRVFVLTAPGGGGRIVLDVAHQW